MSFGRERGIVIFEHVDAVDVEAGERGRFLGTRDSGRLVEGLLGDEGLDGVVVIIGRRHDHDAAVVEIEGVGRLGHGRDRPPKVVLVLRPLILRVVKAVAAATAAVQRWRRHHRSAVAAAKCTETAARWLLRRVRSARSCVCKWDG